jgi:hypothetical protein
MKVMKQKMAPRARTSSFFPDLRGERLVTQPSDEALEPSADQVPVKSPHSTMHWHMGCPDRRIGRLLFYRCELRKRLF